MHSHASMKHIFTDICMALNNYKSTNILRSSGGLVNAVFPYFSYLMFISFSYK